MCDCVGVLCDCDCVCVLLCMCYDDVLQYQLKEWDSSYYNDDNEEKILYKDEDLLTSQKMDQSTYSDELHVDGEDTLSQVS